MLKLLHCGDQHLDSPFAGLDPAHAEARRRGLCETFLRTMRLAAERACDAVLISGDLLDRPRASAETFTAICSAISEFGRPVILSPGNHDPYIGGGTWCDRAEELPKNLYVFSSDRLECFDLPDIGIAVYGYAFCGDRIEASPMADCGVLKREGRVCVLCAHADIDQPRSKYAPISPREISESGLAFAALGHVHTPPPPRVMGETTVAYCGFPEGRGFDELGDGGVSIVTIADDGAVDIERVAVSGHSYMRLPVDIDGAGDDDAVAQAVGKAVAAINDPRHRSLRVILTGETDVEYTPNTERIALLADAGELFSLEVRDESMPLAGGAELAADMTIRGELYRILLDKMQNGDAETRRTAADALRIGLRALDGRPFLDVGGAN